MSSHNFKDNPILRDSAWLLAYSDLTTAGDEEQDKYRYFGIVFWPDCSKPGARDVRAVMMMNKRNGEAARIVLSEQTLRQYMNGAGTHDRGNLETAIKDIQVTKRYLGAREQNPTAQKLYNFLWIIRNIHDPKELKDADFRNFFVPVEGRMDEKVIEYITLRERLKRNRPKNKPAPISQKLSEKPVPKEIVDPGTAPVNDGVPDLKPDTDFCWRQGKYPQLFNMIVAGGFPSTFRSLNAQSDDLNDDDLQAHAASVIYQGLCIIQKASFGLFDVIDESSSLDIGARLTFQTSERTFSLDANIGYLYSFLEVRDKNRKDQQGISVLSRAYRDLFVMQAYMRKTSHVPQAFADQVRAGSCYAPSEDEIKDLMAASGLRAGRQSGPGHLMP